jgi:hypothetical protein
MIWATPKCSSAKFMAVVAFSSLLSGSQPTMNLADEHLGVAQVKNRVCIIMIH